MAVSAVIAGAVTAYSIGQQTKAIKSAQASSQRQFALSQQKAEVQNTRSVRSQIRQQRLAAANMLNAGTQAGGGGSSGMAGGMSSLSAQTAGNINYMNQIASYNTQIGQQALQTQSYMNDAATYGQMADLGMTIFSQVGGFDPATYKKG